MASEEKIKPNPVGPRDDSTPLTSNVQNDERALYGVRPPEPKIWSKDYKCVACVMRVWWRFNAGQLYGIGVCTPGGRKGNGPSRSAKGGWLQIEAPYVSEIRWLQKSSHRTYLYSPPTIDTQLSIV
jgi:hypothetical protein